MNPLSHLIDWLRRPPTGTFADGSPRRYRQAVELTYIETRSYESWAGTADQLFDGSKRQWKTGFRYHDFSFDWRGTRYMVSALDDKLIFTFRDGQSFPARIDPHDLSKVWCLMAEQTCRPWPEDEDEEDDDEYQGPLMAVDVHYADDGSARAAGVLFSDWHVAEPDTTLTTRIDQTAPYEPGAFYKRELPCLLALLEQLGQTPSAIIVDGYVTLGADGKDGLGQHLYRALEEKIPVIGVAKTAFASTPEMAELRRGQSDTPLYVTAAGMSQEVAKSCIADMHGPYRMPTLLTVVDRLARDGDAPRNRGRSC